MINLDDKLAQGYLAECRGHLDTVETDLLAIEKGGAYVDGELVNRIIRAVHSVKGRANVLDLVNIHELAHQTEEVLGRILSLNLVPTPDRVHLLLRAADRLRELIQDPGASNQADIAEIMDALSRLCAGRLTGAEKRFGSAVGQAQQGGRHLRVLLVEDDFASRLLLQTFLSRYGECHIAVNGSEAVEAFRSAIERGLRYDLICMDIMMPEMDGREAVRQVRALEEEHGILSTYGAKIIMTTAVDEIKEVIQCFRELCDTYLMKPIDLAELRGHMKSYQLVQ